MPFNAHFENIVAVLLLSDNSHIAREEIIKDGLKLWFEFCLPLIEQNIGVIKTESQIFIELSPPSWHVVSEFGLKILVQLGAELIVQDRHITNFIALSFDVDHKDHGDQHEHHHQARH